MNSVDLGSVLVYPHAKEITPPYGNPVCIYCSESQEERKNFVFGTAMHNCAAVGKSLAVILDNSYQEMIERFFPLPGKVDILDGPFPYEVCYSTQRAKVVLENDSEIWFRGGFEDHRNTLRNNRYQWVFLSEASYFSEEDVRFALMRIMPWIHHCFINLDVRPCLLGSIDPRNIRGTWFEERFEKQGNFLVLTSKALIRRRGETE
jgi:hypothetical protein